MPISVLNPSSLSSSMKLATCTLVLHIQLNAFEYDDALLPQPEGAGEDAPTPPVEMNQPYPSLATVTFHIVLADKVLKSFFKTDLSTSFRLKPVPLMELARSSSSFLGWSNIVTNTHVKLFHKLTTK